MLNMHIKQVFYLDLTSKHKTPIILTKLVRFWEERDVQICSVQVNEASYDQIALDKLNSNICKQQCQSSAYLCVETSQL